MCINQKEIYNKYSGQYLMVPCGHCKSDLQDRARKRKFKVEDEICDLSKSEIHFCTLTYSNDFIPYFDIRDYESWINQEVDSFPVYRDDEIYTRKNKSKYGKVTEVLVHRGFTIIQNIDYEFMSTPEHKVDKYDFPSPEWLIFHDDFSRLHSRVNGHDEFDFYKCGVLWTPDIQNFFKRLKRRIDVPYSYYYIGEYGGTYGRPHYHILFRTPILSEQEVTAFENAIVESWPFCDWNTQRSQAFPVSVKPASYLGSYTNRYADIPQLFKLCKEMRPCANHSKGFGLQNSAFSCSSLLEKIDSRDVSFIRKINIEGVPSDAVFCLPAYVINRYFPRFKRYSSLSYDEVYQLLQLAANEPRIYEENAVIEVAGYRIVYNKCRLHSYQPYESIFRYFMYRLDVDELQLHRILVRLLNCYYRVFPDTSEYCFLEYAILWERVWYLYHTLINNRHYEETKDMPLLVQAQYYYNLYRFLWYTPSIFNKVKFDFSVFCFNHYIRWPTWIFNVNEFPIVVYKTRKNEEWYETYRKDRKLKSFNLDRYAA